MHIIKTTPQSFLKQIEELIVKEAIRNVSLDQRELILRTVPLFYSHFIKEVSFLQKLNAVLVKNYSDRQITLFLKEDGYQFSLFLEKWERISDMKTCPRWNMGYWRLFVFIEKSETENILLHTSRYILIPFIKSTFIPENIDLKNLISRARENISSMMEHVTFLMGETNNDIKIIPVKVPPLIVDYLRDEKEISVETLKNVFLQLENKHKQQVASLLRENSEHFIEAVASFLTDEIISHEISIPSSSEVYEEFLDAKAHVIDREIESVLYKIERNLREKLEKMDPEELEHYNDESVIYDELLDIYYDVNISTDYIEKKVIDFVYEESETEIDMQHDIKYYVDNYLYEFDLEKLVFYSEEKPFMMEIGKKVETIKNVVKNLSSLISEKDKTLVQRNLSAIFKEWDNLFLNAYKEFLKIYGEEEFKDDVAIKIRENLESFIEKNMREVAEEAIEKILKAMYDSIEENLSSYVVEEIKNFVEERLGEYGDYEE